MSPNGWEGSKCPWASEGSWLCPVHFALAGAGHFVRPPPALLSELGGPPRMDRVSRGSASQPAAGGGRQDFPSILHNPTSSSDGAFSHPHPAPQTLPTFQTFIKYKTPGLYDRTLHSTYAEKRVRHSNVQKSPVPPSPGELPHSQPHCSQHLVERQGCWGSQSHGGAQGSRPAWSRPLLPAAPLPLAWKGEGRQGETSRGRFPPC